VKTTRAVIAAAGPRQRKIPLQTVVDPDGNTRTVLHVLLSEAADAGIEKVAVVIRPGDAAVFEEAAGDLGERLEFVEQDEPRGYGDAVLRARAFTGDESFLLMVSDHLYVSEVAGSTCARLLVEEADRQGCAVSAVAPTHESKLPFFGTIGGRRFEGRDGLFEVRRVVEKPTPTQAEQTLFTPGLREGHYLCFFGMHVLTPRVMEILAANEAANAGDKLELTPALDQLAREERYLAAHLSGRRYDLEARYGILMAQIALAMEGKNRDELLTGLVELLAHSQTSPR